MPREYNTMTGPGQSTRSLVPRLGAGPAVGASAAVESYVGPLCAHRSARARGARCARRADSADSAWRPDGTLSGRLRRGVRSVQCCAAPEAGGAEQAEVDEVQHDLLGTKLSSAPAATDRKATAGRGDPPRRFGESQPSALPVAGRCAQRRRHGRRQAAGKGLARLIELDESRHHSEVDVGRHLLGELIRREPRDQLHAKACVERRGAVQRGASALWGPSQEGAVRRNVRTLTSSYWLIVSALGSVGELRDGDCYLPLQLCLEVDPLDRQQHLQPQARRCVRTHLVRTHTRASKQAHTRAYKHAHARIYPHTHARTRTRARAYTHARIHARAHTHTPALLPSSQDGFRDQCACV
jgi:hypothetical protein